MEQIMNALIISSLLKIAIMVVMGAVCGLFSYFLDYTLWQDSIFGFWQPFLAKCLVYMDNDSDDYKEVMMLDKALRENEFITRAHHHFIYKIMGGCIICTNIWIGVLSFVVIYLSNSIGLNWYYCFPYILVSSALLRRLIKH